MPIISQIISSVIKNVIKNVIPIRGLPTGPNVRYISISTDNGFVVGSDANDGLTKATPFLTIDYAINNTPVGGTLVTNNGEYVFVTFGYWFMLRDITMFSVIIKQTVLTSTNVARVLTISGNAGWTTSTLDGVVLNGNNVSADILQASDPGDGIIKNVTLRNCEMRNPNGNFTDIASNRLQLNIIDCACSSDSDISSIMRSFNLIEGGITINGLSVNHRQISGFVNVIDLEAAAAGVVFDIQRVTGSMAFGPGVTSGQIRTAIKVIGSDNPIVSNNNFSFVSESNTEVLQGINIKANAAGTLTANSPATNYNIINVDAAGGIVILIGTDGSDVNTDNKANDPIATGNKVKFNNSISGHGVMFGNMQGGLSSLNTVDGCFNSILSKGQKGNAQRTTFIGNKVINVVTNGEAFRVKGSDNVDYQNNQHRIEANATARSLSITNNDDTTPSLGCSYTDNNTYSAGAMLGKMAEVVGTTSTCSFSGNNYFSEAPLPVNAFNFGATNYQNVTEWNTDINVSNETEIKKVVNL